MDPKKIEAIAQFEPPQTKQGLQRFLGMIVWYKRFIRDLSTIAATLYEILQDPPPDGREFDIHVPSTKTNRAFQHLRDELIKEPILQRPNFRKPFFVIPDASMYSTGAVLAQDYDGFEHPVHYISKTITKAQQHKHSYFNKTLALHNALKSFNHYLQGVTFYVCSDCCALTHWNTTKKILDKV